MSTRNAASMNVSRRHVLALITAGAGAVLLAACSQAAPASPSASAKPAQSSGSGGAPVVASSASAAASTAAQPRKGGILTSGQTVEIASGGQAGTSPLSGQNITPAALTATFLGYDPLVAYDANLKPQPMLAESWDVSSDFKQIKFNLRKGVQFHSGREFTSDDVEYNLQKVQQPNFAAQFTNMSKWFTSMQKPDKYTVVLSSDQPRPAMFDLFDMLNIADRELVESPDYTKKGGATGPFKFVEWVQGDHIRWVKNPNYWMSGKP
ncbi:MAG TPA: ABC transporter substrate-binding protein, partial [Chloroflexota bacterium]|nr:ABC transporter substrate-binding protein [Chloroflexota bacterium]